MVRHIPTHAALQAHITKEPKMSRVHSFAVAALLLVASCAMSPTSGSTTSTSEVEFMGFVDAPGLKVRLEGYDYGLKKFVAFKTVTAESTPLFRAGEICPDSPALYRYTGKIDLIWWVYWNFVNNAYETKVRAFKITSTGETPILFTANENPGACMADYGFNGSCNFNNIASTKCGFKLGEATVKGVGYTPWNN
jgi:hypothetical protein